MDLAEIVVELQKLRAYPLSPLLQAIVKALSTGDLKEADDLATSHSDKLRDREMRSVVQEMKKILPEFSKHASLLVERVASAHLLSFKTDMFFQADSDDMNFEEKTAIESIGHQLGMLLKQVLEAEGVRPAKTHRSQLHYMGRQDKEVILQYGASVEVYDDHSSQLPNYQEEGDRSGELQGILEKRLKESFGPLLKGNPQVKLTYARTGTDDEPVLLDVLMRVIVCPQDCME